MKASPKSFFALLSVMVICSCSKKNTPAPSVDTKVAVVYDVSNRTANYPTTGIVTDAAGSIYIAVVATNSIDKITTQGVVTVLAGSGSAGSADGTGKAASFNWPGSIAIDAANNIYVADAANNMIRKVTPGGVVTTIAGNGTAGSINGNGKAASFNFPQGIAVDNAGNIYVADTGNDLIRKISPDGTVSTFVGKVSSGSANGTGTNATFNIPQGLAIDNNGTLYVADAGNNLIRKIAPGGVVTTFAGSGFADSTDGIGTSASFDFPDALAFDVIGNLYVTEALSNKVSRISPNGLVARIDVGGVPSFATGYYDDNSSPHPGTSMAYPAVRLPNGISVDKSYNVYVADYGNNLIREADH